MQNLEDLEIKFNEAVKSIDKYKNREEDLKLDNDALLDLYALFKQATCGDCNTSPPFIFSLRETAKYNAWNSLKGKTRDYAMKLYIKKVNKILVFENTIV